MGTADVLTHRVYCAVFGWFGTGCCRPEAKIGIFPFKKTTYANFDDFLKTEKTAPMALDNSKRQNYVCNKYDCILYTDSEPGTNTSSGWPRQGQMATAQNF
jgi:hypothetical protein